MREWRCEHCCDVIGAYEPAVIVVDGEQRLTTRRGEPADFEGKPFHRECYEELQARGDPID